MNEYQQRINELTLSNQKLSALCEKMIIRLEAITKEQRFEYEKLIDQLLKENERLKSLVPIDN